MYVSAKNDRVRQGDLFRNVEFRDAYKSGNDVTFDFCIVITQDCDLEQDVAAVAKMEATEQPDYEPNPNAQPPTNDKYLNTIALCPAFAADQVRSGIHLASIGWTMQNIKSDTLWNDIVNNNNARYHYLAANEQQKLPALVMDFKRVYSLPKEYIVSMMNNKAAKLEDRFGQSVTARFSSYLSRVALPSLDKKGEIIPEAD